MSYRAQTHKKSITDRGLAEIEIKVKGAVEKDLIDSKQDC